MTTELTANEILALIDAEIERYDAMDHQHSRGDGQQALVLELLKTKILEAKIARVESAAPAVPAPKPALPGTPKDDGIEQELAQQGLRRAERHESGWYVYTSFGKVWATDEVPAPRVPDALYMGRLMSDDSKPPVPMADKFGNSIYISEEDAAKNCAAGFHEWSEMGEGTACFCLHCGATIDSASSPVVLPAPVPSPDSAAGKVKLSKAQRYILELLINRQARIRRGWMADRWGTSVDGSHKLLSAKTIQWLIAHKYADEMRGVGKDHDWYTLFVTPAGRLALAQR